MPSLDSFGRKIAIEVIAAVFTACLLSSTAFVKSLVRDSLHGNDVYLKPILQRPLLCGRYYLTGYRIVNESPSQTKGDIKLLFEIYKARDVRIEIEEGPTNPNVAEDHPMPRWNTSNANTTSTPEKVIYISPGDSETNISILNRRDEGWNRILANRQKGIVTGKSADLALILWTFHSRSGIKGEQLTLNGNLCQTEDQYIAARGSKQMVWHTFWVLFGIGLAIEASIIILIIQTFRKYVRFQNENKVEPTITLSRYRKYNQ